MPQQLGCKRSRAALVSLMVLGHRDALKKTTTQEAWVVARELCRVPIVVVGSTATVVKYQERLVDCATVCW